MSTTRRAVEHSTGSGNKKRSAGGGGGGGGGDPSSRGNGPTAFGGGGGGVSSIPVALLQEAVQHKVKVVLVGGASYYGTLERVDGATARMNLLLSGVHYNAPDGAVEAMERCVVRGANIKWVVLPTLLQQAPLMRGCLEKAMTRKKGQVSSAAIAAAAGGRKRPRVD